MNFVLEHLIESINVNPGGSESCGPYTIRLFLYQLTPDSVYVAILLASEEVGT